MSTNFGAVHYTEDKGDFEIPVEDETEETGEEDTEPI